MLDPSFWRHRRVYLTGHTGFKGAWMTLILRHLGANVCGIALAPEGPSDLFLAADVARSVDNVIGDIRDPDLVKKSLVDAEPDILIHMAAQSLVRRSYSEPVATYATNVMGTVNVLNAVSQQSSVRAAVIVTSDKCYEHGRGTRPFRETDALGGHDPYSNSKACAELVTDAYRRSFFHGKNTAAIASVRAGNVIGGGDWALDRLVPDAMRAFIAREVLRVRNPSAVRPWQHVLDPVLAYLSLAHHLFEYGHLFAEAWNFGPGPDSEVSVSQVADRVAQLWGAGARWERDGGQHPHEAILLKLDCEKAKTRLGWRPAIGLEEALRLTVDWYRSFDRKFDMRDLTLEQIEFGLAATRTLNYTGSRIT